MNKNHSRLDNMETPANDTVTISRAEYESLRAGLAEDRRNQQRLVDCKHEKEILRQKAQGMRNEIVGLCSLGEHHMREFAGNTNYHCLIDAVKAFDEITQSRGPAAGGKTTLSEFEEPGSVSTQQDTLNDRGSNQYYSPLGTNTEDVGESTQEVTEQYYDSAAGNLNSDE